MTMKVFVAGSTGVIGRPLLPLLVAAGHEVTGLTRSRERAAVVERAGAAAIADVLDAGALARAVAAAAPDVIVNLLTAIPAVINPKRMARDFALTDRLRTDGTGNLLSARPGVRLISESIAFAYEPNASTPAVEGVALWSQPPKQFVASLNAVRELERMTTHSGGLNLRLGHLYGPGSAYGPDGATVTAVRAAKLPIVGRGTAVFSFINAVDAASAIVAAVDRPDVSGTLNIVDDDPAPVACWLPELATILGAPAPREVPAVLARVIVGGWGVAFMTRLRGADNTRARAALAWAPQLGSWRQGFRAELGSAP